MAKNFTDEKLKKIFLSEKTRDISSAVATFFVSLILFLCFLLIPVKNKKYTEIRIQLDEPKIEEKIEEIVPPKPENKIEPSVEEKVLPPKKTTPAKTETPKQKTTPTNATNTAPAKKLAGKQSVEERMAENTKQSQKKSSTFDDSVFGNDSSVSETSQSSKNTKTLSQPTNELSGTAAKSNESSSSSSANQSSNPNAKLAGSASSSTTDALNEISQTTTQTLYKVEFSDTNDDIAYTYSTVSSSRRVKTHYPITLSEESENQFAHDGRTLKVKITISFDANGFVTGVSFTPADTFPRSAMDEIRKQLYRWQFEAGDREGKSEFYYTVRVE